MRSNLSKGKLLTITFIAILFSLNWMCKAADAEEQDQCEVRFYLEYIDNAPLVCLLHECGDTTSIIVKAEIKACDYVLVNPCESFKKGRAREIEVILDPKITRPVQIKHCQEKNVTAKALEKKEQRALGLEDDELVQINYLDAQGEPASGFLKISIQESRRKITISDSITPIQRPEMKE